MILQVMVVRASGLMGGEYSFSYSPELRMRVPEPKQETVGGHQLPKRPRMQLGVMDMQEQWSRRK